jgi:hypothetical protein
MLDIALQFLKNEINSYIKLQTGSATDVVNLSQLVDEMGKYAIKSETVGIALINIEEERFTKAQLPDYSYVNGQHIKREPELKLNLHVIVAANFTHYDIALKYLSFVLTYFQSHPFFTPSEYPALDTGIAKLIVELQSLGYEQLNQIWAYIGGKQLPSVIYKVRLLAIQDQTLTAVQPPLTTIVANLHRR